MASSDLPETSLPLPENSSLPGRLVGTVKVNLRVEPALQPSLSLTQTPQTLYTVDGAINVDLPVRSALQTASSASSNHSPVNTLNATVATTDNSTATLEVDLPDSTEEPSSDEESYNMPRKTKAMIEDENAALRQDKAKFEEENIALKALLEQYQAKLGNADIETASSSASPGFNGQAAIQTDAPDATTATATPLAVTNNTAEDQDVTAKDVSADADNTEAVNTTDTKGKGKAVAKVDSAGLDNTGIVNTEATNPTIKGKAKVSAKNVSADSKTAKGTKAKDPKGKGKASAGDVSADDQTPKHTQAQVSQGAGSITDTIDPKVLNAIAITYGLPVEELNFETRDVGGEEAVFVNPGPRAESSSAAAARSTAVHVSASSSKVVSANPGPQAESSAAAAARSTPVKESASTSKPELTPAQEEARRAKQAAKNKRHRANVKARKSAGNEADTNGDNDAESAGKGKGKAPATNAAGPANTGKGKAPVADPAHTLRKRKVEDLSAEDMAAVYSTGRALAKKGMKDHLVMEFDVISKLYEDWLKKNPKYWNKGVKIAWAEYKRDRPDPEWLDHHPEYIGTDLWAAWQNCKRNRAGKLPMSETEERLTADPVSKTDKRPASTPDFNFSPDFHGPFVANRAGSEEEDEEEDEESAECVDSDGDEVFPELDETDYVEDDDEVEEEDDDEVEEEEDEEVEEEEDDEEDDEVEVQVSDKGEDNGVEWTGSDNDDDGEEDNAYRDPAWVPWASSDGLKITRVAEASDDEPDSDDPDLTKGEAKRKALYDATGKLPPSLAAAFLAAFENPVIDPKYSRKDRLTPELLAELPTATPQRRYQLESMGYDPMRGQELSMAELFDRSGSSDAPKKPDHEIGSGSASAAAALLAAGVHDPRIPAQRTTEVLVLTPRQIKDNELCKRLLELSIRGRRRPFKVSDCDGSGGFMFHRQPRLNCMYPADAIPAELHEHWEVVTAKIEEEKKDAARVAAFGRVVGRVFE